MPDLRQRIMWWVWADTDDRAWFGWLSDRWPWHRRLSMEDAIARPLCWFYGHNPIRDQCGNPDHDACSWCRTSMPGQAHRERVAVDQTENRADEE